MSDKQTILIFDKNKNDTIKINVIDAINMLYIGTGYIKDMNDDINEDKTKQIISKVEEKIPLYDAYTENLYMIGKYDVYNRVMYQNYRLPDEELIENIEKKRKKYENEQKINKKNENILLDRKIHKIVLMMDFLKNYDLVTLKDTYIKVFYKYSEKVGREITVCGNPSFNPKHKHIRPYYTKNELIHKALNLGIENESDVVKLCKIVQDNEITYDVLQSHQQYIIKSNKLGLVQYYTLQGSYFINKYLRNLVNYGEQNEYLENIISPMWDLVKTAPSFDKSYILYRFIQEDSFLAGLKINDIYVEQGFMSTTRDPFYKPKTFEFGSILIKIKVPANIKGVGLCLETVSHFPQEQEIIFPPKTALKLIKINKTDAESLNKIKAKYEFEWIDSKPISFMKKLKMDKLTEIDFIKLEKPGYQLLEDNIKSFIDKYTNRMKQFISVIGDAKFVTTIDSFNSTSTYADFYALNIPDGFSLCSIYNNYILFFIEIGTTENNMKEMHVNYYTKYSYLEKNKIIDDDKFILFLASIAYHFDITQIAIYAEYRSRESEKGDDYGSYCVDIYDYVINNAKRYKEALNIELMPKFTYNAIDTLKTINVEEIINKTDPDELYQVYHKIFKLENNKNKATDFYIWIINNKCYLLDTFILKLNKIFINGTNPFLNDVYIFDPATFLYNRNIIKTYPIYNNMKIQIRRNIISE